MRNALPRSLWLCFVALEFWSGGAPTLLRADEDVKPIVIEGKLAKDDPRDAVRKQSGHKLHEVKLEAGKCYRIDLSSKDFDPFLRLEDAQKKQLGFNDDIDYAAKHLDARLFVAPLRTGTYRLIVTSYEGGATGVYRLRVQPLGESGKPAIEQRRLDKESRVAQGRYFELRPLTVGGGEVQVVEAASKEFAPRLLLVDDKGRQALDGVVSEQGKGVARLVVAAARAGRYQVLVTTAAAGESGGYAWRVATYPPSASAVADKGKVDRTAVDAAYAHAEELRKQARLAEAVAAYERVVRLAQQAFGEADPDTATLMGNLAQLYRQQAQYGKAEPLLLRSRAIWESKLGKDHPLVAMSFGVLAGLYQDQGRYAKAEPLYRRSLAILESQLGEEHVHVATTLNNLAGLYQAQGRYGEAEPLFQRSLAITESRLGKDHPNVAVSLNNLAELCREQGQYARAERLYLRSLAIEESRLGKDHPHVGSTLNNLALLYREQGEYGKAEPLYRRSLAISESKLGKDHPHVADSLIGLAVLYGEQGEYGKAEPLFVRGLAIYESKLGRDHRHVAATLNGLALMYKEKGQYAKAEPLFRRCLAIRESQLGKHHPHVATTLDNLSVLYAAQERWGDACEAFDRARRSLRSFLDRELAALPDRDQLALLGTWSKHNYHGALSLGWLQRDRQAVRRASAVWLLNGQALAQEALSQQTLLQRNSAGQSWASLAAELLDLRRQLAALAVQTPSAAALAVQTPPAAALDARRQLLDELGQREQDLAKRVSQLSGRGASASSWLELEELRKALPADGVLITIARFPVFDFQATGKQPKWQPPRYAAWLIDAKTVQIVDLGEAARLDSAVQAVRRELERAAATVRSDGEPDAEKRLRQSLEALSKRVLHPLLPHLKDRRRWLVCPDGALWLVPWNALLLPDGKYVVERHTVSHLVSGRDFIPRDDKVKATAPVVLADPDFDLAPGGKGGSKPAATGAADPWTRHTATLGDARFGRLPGTAAEAQLIAPKVQAYAGAAAKVYTEAAATEAVFKALKHPRVLVLSTHGFFLPDVERKADDDFLRERPKRAARPEENPLLRCGLALAGANERAAAVERGVDDGILTALEILQADLRGTELVVLSACETGLGEVRNGEGVAGLRQAFQLAGAQSVLATLWQIPDRETAQLMGRFFDHLAAGRGRADALRLAQLEMIRIRRQREGAAHPFYWAAFTLTGNWR